jgi:NAD(P)-dependent dehydrogenase (short-subunit alcohol dehydrogenase family)
MLKPFADHTLDDWHWIVDVDLYGVVNMLRAFLPAMRGQQGEKHIVNTASMNSWIATAAMSAYSAAKHAVLGLSDSLRDELETEDFGVSVLCPGGTRTQIASSDRNRHDRYGSGQAVDPAHIPMMWRSYEGQSLPAEGLDPMVLGRTVRRGIENNWHYIFSTGADADMWVELLTARFRHILTAVEGAASTAAQERGDE